jgi:hypothetical protein
MKPAVCPRLDERKAVAGGPRSGDLEDAGQRTDALDIGRELGRRRVAGDQRDRGRAPDVELAL